MTKGLAAFVLMLGLAILPLQASAGDKHSISSGQVQDMQQALADSGYYRAGVDGRWGPYTDSALRSFQHDNGLAVTGHLDKETRKLLSIRPSEDKQKTLNRKIQ